MAFCRLIICFRSYLKGYDVKEFSSTDLRDIQAALGATTAEIGQPPEVLEMAVEKSKVHEAKGLVPLNRKQRRAAAKQRRSKVYQKAGDRHVANIRRQIAAAQAQQKREQEDAEAQNDLLFAHPKNVERIHRVFEPVERVLNELVATGEINAMPDGTPLMYSAEDGHWYPVGPALISVVETYEKLAKVHGWNDHSDGLRRLAKRLELMMPIFQGDVDAARKTIEWMKICTLTITPRQFTAEAVEIQIKDELAAQRA